jgi:hypothetical protein
MANKKALFITLMERVPQLGQFFAECLDLEKWRFFGQQQRTPQPTALPLAHARGVKSE